MRLALQALFNAGDNETEEGRERRLRIEREMRDNARSAAFFRKLRAAVADRNLKAPEIFAEESYPDANVVAEYLDCQSESDEVREEYERLCAESPEALAEVGGVYDALTNRLEREIEVPKNCRRRLYYIAWEEESTSAPGATVEAVPRSCAPSAPIVDLPEDAPEPDKGAKIPKARRAKRSVEKKRGYSFPWAGIAVAVVVAFGSVYLWGQAYKDGAEDPSQISSAPVESESRSGFLASENEFAEDDSLDRGPYGGESYGGDAYDEFATADSEDDERESEAIASLDFITDENENKSENAPEYVARATDDEALYARSATERERSRARGGLDDSDTGLAEWIVLPERNNDVFGKKARY